MNEREKSQKYTYLNQLSTQALEGILRADGEQPDSVEPEMILYILEVIKERENGNSAEAAADTERAWAEFQKYYNTPDGVGKSLYPTKEPKRSSPGTASKRNHLKHHRFAMAAVLILMAVLMAMPVLGNNESLFQVIGRWTAEQIGFGSPAQPGDSSAPREYASPQEMLEAYNITESVLPTAFPEGFELTDFGASTISDFGVVSFKVYYKKGDAVISIDIIQHIGISEELNITYEKDTYPVQKYVYNDTSYYLFQNNGMSIAAYWINNLECSFGGDISMDELIEMIDSIR